MKNRWRVLKSIIVLAAFCGFLACFTDCGNDAAGTGPGPVPKLDTAKVDTVGKDLGRLASALARIPVPMGTRYFSAPAPKTAAVQACRGEQDIFAIPANPRGILGIDTVAYLDSLGAAHCLHQDPTLREDHARYVFDPACGEAWERIQIGITPDDYLPRYRIQGTGKLRFISGWQADIEAYALDMALDNSSGAILIQNAHLRLAVSDGHVLRLDLVKDHPYQAPDFFPFWGNPAPGEPIMGGPVLFGADTVGHVLLYGDRSLSFQDAAGRPVTPK